jgi:uncharacterized protein (TIGR00725 family)
MNCMKAIIGVMGARAGHATREDIRLAYSVGRLVAQLGAVVLTGGITGVMAASGRGAWDCGGTVLAIGPDNDRRRLNPFIDIAVITGMGPGRNFLNVLSSNIVVAVGVRSPGTLAEVAFALQLKRPLIILGGTPEMRAHVRQLADRAPVFGKSVSDVEPILRKLVNRLPAALPGRTARTEG